MGNEFRKNQIVSFQFAYNSFSYLETDRQLVRSFLVATRYGHVRTVDRMLRDEMPVNVSDVADQTAHHIATYNSQTDVVKYLVHEGADVNRQTGQNKYTSLRIAAHNNNTEVARLLLNNGADINLKNDENKTPLDEAHKGSEIESLLLHQLTNTMIKVLLNKKRNSFLDVT